MTPVGQLLAVSLVVMGLAHTLTRERIFEPLRRRCGGKETWLGYLVSCPYCASHWIAFLIVPLTGTTFIQATVPYPALATVLTWFLSSILVAVVAAFFRVIFYFVDETQGLVRRRQQTAEEETEAARALREQVAANTNPDGRERVGLPPHPRPLTATRAEREPAQPDGR